jgi:4-carboxymuconolactone decarboxylase
MTADPNDDASSADEVRIAPLPEDQWDEETAALLDAVGPLNLFTTMANHPKLMKRWLVFGGHVLSKSTLPARERELVILRVGWRCGSDYEFGQHTLIGRDVGLDDEEIRRTTVDGLDDWSDDDAALVTAADELVADQRIGDATWARLQQRWSTEQLMDLVFTVGQYVTVCMALRTFGVQRDAGVPGFPT